MPFSIPETVGDVAADAVKGVAKAAANSAIQDMANAVQEALGKALGTLGTMWTTIKTPILTGGSGGSLTPTPPPLSDNIVTILAWVKWIGLTLAVMSLVMLGAKIAISQRRGEGVLATGQIGLVLFSVVLISGSSSLVAAILPSRISSGSDVVVFIQNSLYWYMAIGVVVSVIIGAVRMAWLKRAEPGLELIQSLITLVVVTGLGLTAIGMLTAAADFGADWLIGNAVNGGAAEFGRNMATLLTFDHNSGALLIIILGIGAIFASFIQLLLMLARSGMLVIMAGILPFTAMATNTAWGKAWLRRAISWTFAFIAYKPVAAVIYATAFRLAASNPSEAGLTSILTGLMMMIMAVIALPALMRFTMPAVGALAGGAIGAGGGAAAATALAMPLAAGAAPRAYGRLGGYDAGFQGFSGPTGPSGANGSPSGTVSTAPSRDTNAYGSGFGSSPSMPNSPPGSNGEGARSTSPMPSGATARDAGALGPEGAAGATPAATSASASPTGPTGATGAAGPVLAAGTAAARGVKNIGEAATGAGEEGEES